MNKKTKSLIAGVVGAGLLLGAGGTFAIWNDRATLNDDGLITGTLAADDATLTTWIRTDSWSTQATDIEVDYLVPGDTAEAQINNGFLTLVGDSIRAELTIDGLDEAIGRAPVIVTLRGAGSEIPLINYANDYVAFRAVFSADEVALFNDAIDAGVYPTLSIAFPLTTDGEEPAADESNWWGVPGDSLNDGGRNAEIVLRDNVQLIFVQTDAASTLEGLVP